MKPSLTLVLCLITSARLVADEAPAQSARTRIPDAVRGSLSSHLDITYARYGDRTLELDLYRPKDVSKPLPGIVCIHGGGWAKGNRKGHGTLAMALAARGFVAATISYRLSGESPFPAAIHDCKAAVRWMRANAAEYGVDPDHIGAIGLSAGGHLTALLGTTAGVEELEGNGGHQEFSSAIQAAVPMGAQTDLESERTKRVSASREKGGIWQQFLGGTQAEQFAAYQLASPLFHLDRNDPPQAFVSGETDDPSTHADTFRAAMARLAIPSQLKLVEGAPHPFLNRQVWFDTAVSNAADFLTTHLKQEPATRNDIEFANVDGHSLKLDLYLPAQPSGSRLVVWIHGGGWRAGSRKRCYISWLADHGYTVASISYRLTDKAIFPAQIHDCKAAVRWLRANAAAFGYSTERIAVAGSSAGGHLAALMGTSGGVKELEGTVGGNADQSSRVAAVIDYYGATDFVLRSKTQPHRANKEGSVVYRLLGGGADRKIELAKSASAAFHITKDDPPFLVFHGEDDQTVLIDQSERIQSAYTEAGLPIALHVVKGAGHGGDEFYSGRNREIVLEFLQRHLD